MEAVRSVVGRAFLPDPPLPRGFGRAGQDRQECLTYSYSVRRAGLNRAALFVQYACNFKKAANGGGGAELVSGIK
jgi:hypothetical protein